MNFHKYNQNKTGSKQPDYVRFLGERRYEIKFDLLDQAAFPCPKCGAIISPDDKTEEVYTIIEPKVKDDKLVELVLMCNKCNSQIQITNLYPKIEVEK